MIKMLASSGVTCLWSMAISLHFVPKEAVVAQPKPAGPLKFPTLFPPWEPEWNLLRSTIAQPCNYSGWFDADLAAEFGVISIDWANHENSYRSRPYTGIPGGAVYPDDADLGQGIGINFGLQAHKILSDPQYEGFWLRTVNGTPLPGNINGTDGRRIGAVFDFRNESLVHWFINEYVGSDQVIANPDIDGWFADDVYGLGSPGSPDKTPVVKESGLTPEQIALWNKGQQAAVVGAQNLAVKKYGAFNWQNFQPMCEPNHDEPCPNGWTGMVAVDRGSCINGGPDNDHGKGFAGMRTMCSKEGGSFARDIPWLYQIWHDRNLEAESFPGQGSCTELSDCKLDTCKEHGGGVDCAAFKDIRQRIAAFLLSRGDYAWMGYNWMGCAGSDHKRKYMPFPNGPYQCPQNKSMTCAGWTDGARWQAPKDWDPQGAMKLDFGNGGKPIDKVCVETSDGVFERRFANFTVKLDCNRWTAEFISRNE